MNQIKTGAIISYAALVINILTGIFYTPWMIRSIGREDFGLYTLTMSIISLFVFDFGLSAAVTRFVAKYLALGRQDLADRVLGVAYKLYICIDMLLFTVLLALYFFIPTIYQELTTEEIDKFKVVYMIAAFFSVMSFPFIPTNGILTAHEKIIQLKISDILQKLFIVFFMSIALSLGGGLYVLVMINAIAGMLGIAFKIWCINKYTTQNITWKHYDKSELKAIASFSGWVSVLALAQRCIFNIAPSILGIMSGSVAIAILGIAITIEGYCFTFANALNGVFLPRVSRILIKEQGDVMPLMVKVGRVQLMIVAFIIIVFCCLGSDFINIWVGDAFEGSYLCAILLILPSFFHLPQMIGNEAVYAKNEVKRLAVAYVVMALCNIVGAFLLSPMWGAVGISISICSAYIVRTIGLDYILWKYLHIDIFHFFRETFGKLFFPIGCTLLTGYALSIVLPASSWGMFMVDIVVLFMVYGVMMYLFGMNEFERRLFTSPVETIVHKIRP